MKFEYPVALSGDEDKAPKFLKGASNRTGYFPVGRLNTWHGGIHFEGDRAIRAIADGKIIAFRVPKTYLTETVNRSEEHTSELQSRPHLVCRLLLEKKKQNK